MRDKYDFNHRAMCTEWLSQMLASTPAYFADAASTRCVYEDDRMHDSSSYILLDIVCHSVHVYMLCHQL
jgi:hypothetical protein